MREIRGKAEWVLSGHSPAESLRERLEERIVKVSCRLAGEKACQRSTNGLGSPPGSLEDEEELLDEAADLERLLHLDTLERARRSRLDPASLRRGFR